MKIRIYNGLGKVIKIIDNIVNIKSFDDDYYIDCAEDGVSIKYHFDCKKANIEEVHIIHE